MTVRFYIFILIVLAQLGHFSAQAAISDRCQSTASVFIKRGTLQDPARDRSWDLLNITRALRGRIDPNTCIQEILVEAISNSREYWQEVYSNFNCESRDSRHYSIVPCRNSGNFTDAVSNFLYLDGIESLYRQVGSGESFELCGETIEIMQSNFIGHLQSIQSFVGSEYGELELNLAPSDRFNGDPCLASLTCSEKLKFSAIAAQLAELEAQGNLTEESSRRVIEGELLSEGPAARAKIMKALVSHSLSQSAPPEDLETLIYLRQGQDFISDELRDFQRAAQAFQDINDQMQRGASEGWPWQRAWT